MVKCAKCRQRKAKRRCPALRDDLCPACCGRYREKDIPCPPTCRFLAEHKPYQEEKVLRRRPERRGRVVSKSDEVFTDERLAWLGWHIEAPLFEIGERRPEWTDGDAILALEYAREKLARGRSLLLLPGEERHPSNAAGEAVFQSMEACRFEKTVVLASGTQGYSAEEKTAALDRVILDARDMARENIRGRRYLEHLRQTFDRIRDASRASKLITP
jgi:hypothetical protein